MKKYQLVDWLMTQGRFNTGFASFINELCNKLLELDVPVKRVRINFRTLHPQVVAWSSVWDYGVGAEVNEISKEVMATENYIGSPIQYVYENDKSFRRKLNELSDDAHSVLFELQQQGLTDYYASPIKFSTGLVNVVTFATDHPNGFSDNCITFLSELSVLVAPFIETLATRRLARNLLETYIGPRTGRRILEGQIQRGDGEEIKAAIWFSDFRNFTKYTETLSLEQMLETLNQYFEIVHENVEKNGGEILRFIGDAMLIVFPVDESRTIRQACSSALSSAMSAQQQVNAINLTRKENNKPKIEFGVGLHEGCVMYGNVGAPRRLDFTVMGVAVNRTARLESLTKELNCPILVSGDFNDQIEHVGQFKGEYAVKGVTQALKVFSVSIN